MVYHILIASSVVLNLKFIIICVLSLKSFQIVGGEPKYNVIEGHVNEIISGQSNIASSQVYYYEISQDTVTDSQNAKIRIFTQVSIPAASRECPLLFTVQAQRTALSWELPVTHRDSETGKFKIYSTMARTLCLDSTASIEQTISVMVTSCSERDIEFSILLTVSEDLVVRLGETITTTLSPTLPDFYRFSYSVETSKNLLIRLNSSDDVCLKFSVQDALCPIMDQETNIQSQGFWQTMSTKAGTTVREGQFPNGFVLVFVVLKEDKRCLEYFGIVEKTDARIVDESLPRTKNITFIIEETIHASKYVLPTVLPLVFLLILILVVFSIFSGFQILNVKVAGKDQIDHNMEMNELSGPRNSQESESGPGSSQESESCCSSFRTPIKLEALKKVNSKKLENQSQRYFWIMLIITIFYCVPVFQLITNYLKVVYRTGEQDICYYNYLCARTLGYLMDFNHIYSNTAYIVLGITFILFVRIRRNSFVMAGYDEGQNEDSDLKSVGCLRKIFPVLDSYRDYGVLQHFGLFYALGLALMAEGLLSGAYHICPNQSNFQFDTSFMYVIAILGLVKVYQFRHPIHISVNVTFIILAIVSSSSVLGLLFNNTIFKICFSILYFITIVVLLTYLYFIGFVKDQNDHFVTGWLQIFHAILYRVLGPEEPFNKQKFTFSSHKSQILLPIGALFFNVLFIILQWTALYETDFATQMLGIFVMNLFIYSIYYGIMKLIHGEYKGKLWLQPLIYVILAGIFWAWSLYYFGNGLTSWAESPAVSKTQNDFCIVADFYDYHDMWHFLSAVALFFSFMMLLTIDDDLLPVKHDSIPVF